MYINSEFIFYELDNKNIILKEQLDNVYENSICYCDDLYFFVDHIFHFFKYNIKSYSIFFLNYFEKYWKENKLRFKYKIRIKRRKKVKKFFNNQYFLTNILSDTSLLYWKKRKKWLRMKKITISKPMRLILRSRRLLKFLFSKVKLKSSKLTNKLTQLFTNKTQHNSKIFFNTLGCVILRSSIISNLKDIYYFLQMGLIKINNKTVYNFFQILKPGDIINFYNNLFFINYFWYFKTISNRWLKRKKKKNLRKLRKFINLNKTTTNINVVVKRWLYKTKSFKSKFSNFEVDYRFFTICVFSSQNNFIKKNIYSTCLNSIGIFNTWYYNF